MKAMLLAAGEGRRLRPLTLKQPKPLLEVGGKALIVYHLEALAKAGIRDVVINVSYLGEQIITALADGAAWGLNIRYSKESEPLETAGGIAHAAHLLGEAPFLLVSADVWSDISYSSLIEDNLAEHEQARLVMVNNPSHHPEGDFSVAEDQRLLLRAAEQPSYTYSGIGLIKPQAVLNCRTKRSAFPLLEVFNELISQQTIFAQRHSGKWTDVGTPQRLSELNTALLPGKI